MEAALIPAQRRNRSCLICTHVLHTEDSWITCHVYGDLIDPVLDAGDCPTYEDDRRKT